MLVLNAQKRPAGSGSSLLPVNPPYPHLLLNLASLVLDAVLNRVRDWKYTCAKATFQYSTQGWKFEIHACVGKVYNIT